MSENRKNVKREFYLQLFGKFSLSGMGRTLHQHEFSSERLVLLAAYLLRHSNTCCTFRELIDFMWPEDDLSNPGAALKNLIARLRKKLAEVWPGVDLILTGSGNYSWNPDIPLRADYREFDELYSRIPLISGGTERERALTGLTSLYQGQLMEDYSHHHGVLYTQQYYHSRYLEAVQMLCEEYENKADHLSMELLCERAIHIDPVEESLHVLLMRTYLQENRLEKAEKHYFNTVRLMNESLGQDVCAELEALYQQLLKQMGERRDGMEDVLEVLSEPPEGSGAFFCDFGVFRKIYELEAGRAGRSDEEMTLLMITALETEERSAAPAVARTATALPAGGQAVSEAMNSLQDVMTARLRQGDVFTRYGAEQFLVLLKGLPETKTDIVVDRIGRAYDETAAARTGGCFASRFRISEHAVC